MGYDTTCFTAGVLDLAAHGRLSIDQDGGDIYTLTKSPNPPADTLRLDARKLLATLFDSGDILVLSNINHATLSSAQTHTKKPWR